MTPTHHIAIHLPRHWCNGKVSKKLCKKFVQKHFTKMVSATYTYTYQKHRWLAQNGNHYATPMMVVEFSAHNDPDRLQDSIDNINDFVKKWQTKFEDNPVKVVIHKTEGYYTDLLENDSMDDCEFDDDCEQGNHLTYDCGYAITSISAINTGGTCDGENK